jgi:serine/threonine protein kinase
MLTSSRREGVDCVDHASGAPKPGDIIAGKYLIERPLGSGGMGAVFEVSHVVTHKHFALKWLLHVSAAEGGARRFVREAQVASRVVHPSVLEVYDIGQHGHSLYMIMELLEGESLAERLTRVERMSASEACAILLPCMEGVAALHEAGIIHRDLKPANIFLCQARGRQLERPKVLDFGISKVEDGGSGLNLELTNSGAILGTPHYMAPEQMRGQASDCRVDIYAFGVMLYEMLSGERPFEANSYAELVLEVQSGTPKPLAAVLGCAPTVLTEAIGRAMARDPVQRYQALSEFIRAIEADASSLAATLPPSDLSRKPATIAAAHAPSGRPIEPRQARPRLWLRVSFGLALVVAVALSGLSWVGPIRSAWRAETSLRAATAPTLVADSVHLNVACSPTQTVARASDPQACAGAVPLQAAAPSARSQSVRRAAPTPTLRKPGARASTAVLLHAALQQLLDGHVGAAADLYTHVTELEPDSEPAWRGLGLANEHLGRRVDAVRAWREALRVTPDGEKADLVRARLRKLEVEP